MAPRTTRTSKKRTANGDVKASVTRSEQAEPIYQETVYAFAENLLKRQKFLSELKTVPSSRPGSDTEYDEDDDMQIGEDMREVAVELRKRVCEVYGAVEGDTSRGQWTLISKMLKPPSTRGKYSAWVPPRPTDRVTLEKAATEKGKGDDNKSEETVAGTSLSQRKAAELKEKVHSWQLRVVEEAQTQPEEQIPLGESHDTVAEPAKGKKTMVKRTASGHDPLDPSPLGFAVQKTSMRMKSKPKPSASVKKPVQSSDEPMDHLDLERVTRRKAIHDVPETSFLPPSFSSSQIEHSTPINQSAAPRRQPSPISRIQEESHEAPPISSSPLSPSRMDTSPLVAVETRSRAKKSPEMSKTPFPVIVAATPTAHSTVKSPIAGLGLSASLPAIGSPKTPTRAAIAAAKLARDGHKGDEDGTATLHQKRVQLSSPEDSTRPKKLLRPDDKFYGKGSSSTARGVEVTPLSSPLSSTPMTPKKGAGPAVPTLTELLSAKKPTPKGKAKPRLSSGGGGLDVRLGSATPARDGRNSESVEMVAMTTSQTQSAKEKTTGISPSTSQSQIVHRSGKLETQRTATTATSLPQRQPGWDELSIQPSANELTNGNYTNALDFTSGYSHSAAKPLLSVGTDSDSSEDEDVTPVAPEGDAGKVRMPDLMDRSQGRSQHSAKEPVIVPNSPLPDFTFDADAFAPQLASTQQNAIQDKDFSVSLASPKHKSSPLRGGAARHSSQSQPLPLSRSPSKTPSQQQTESQPESQLQFQFGYSSQMDLDGGVDKVSRFLEKDISIDVDEEISDDGVAFGRKGWAY